MDNKGVLPNKLYLTKHDKSNIEYLIVRHHINERDYVITRLYDDTYQIKLEEIISLSYFPTTTEMIKLLQGLGYPVDGIAEVKNKNTSTKILKAIRDYCDKLRDEDANIIYEEVEV